MEPSKRSRQVVSGSFIRLLLSAVLITASVWLYLHRQFVLDQLTAWRFTPSSEMQAVADGVRFTDRGYFLLDATRPELRDRDSFNVACTSESAEHTAVLGCYSAGRTYIFDIDNEQLDGIKEVTTAHEMLHAAYERLSESERQRVNKLLEAQSLGASEPRIAELMASYAKTEPGERLNELHSILGTELISLSPQLETYYRQYFADRSAVVRMATSYQSVFEDLTSRQEVLVSELNKLADSIDAASTSYSRSQTVLNADVQSFNSRARSGSMTREQYDLERSELSERQNQLKREYDAIQSLISEYDAKKSQLAVINTESTVLNRSINSTLPPAEGID